MSIRSGRNGKTTRNDFYREVILFSVDEDEYEEDASDDLEDYEDDKEPFVGIIGFCRKTFDIAYGRSEEVSRDSVLQKIFTRRYGNDCRICGYNYQRLFGVSSDYCNTYLYIPALKGSDWEKSFVCVCRSCEEVLADDQGRFVEVLKGTEKWLIRK